MPADTPVTVPVSEPTVATVVLVLVHDPPPAGSLSVTVSLAHTLAGPLIVVGERLTVIVVCALHPAGVVYAITVDPVVPPVTIPVGPIVAIEVFTLLQVPPAGVLVSDIVAPTQTAVGPVMAVGNRFTVTTAVRTHPVLVAV